MSLVVTAGTIDNNFERLIESMDGTASTSKGYRFDLGTTGDRLRALLRDGTGASSSKQHSTTLAQGAWYFAAVRYDQDDLLQVTVIDRSTPLSASTIGTATQTAGTPTGAIVYGAGRPTVLAVENSSGGSGSSFQGAMDDIHHAGRRPAAIRQRFEQR